MQHYNEVRLQSAFNYISPLSKLEGREDEILKYREEKLIKARTVRAINRENGRAKTQSGDNLPQFKCTDLGKLGEQAVGFTKISKLEGTIHA